MGLALTELIRSNGINTLLAQINWLQRPRSPQFSGLLSASTIFRQCFPFFGWLCLKLHPDYLYVSSRNKREGLRRVFRNWAEGKCDRSEKTQAACRTGIELRYEQNADW